MSTTRESNSSLSDDKSLELKKQNSKRASRRERLSRFLVEKGPAITVIALILSVLQFIYAGWSAYWGANRIDRIADSISTQYVDVFPNNMQDIISLINRTQKKLTVITDVAAYGHFSSPENSREYIRALNDLNNSKKDVQIRLLYYDRAKGKTELADQFASDIKEWASFTNAEAFRKYASFHGGKGPIDADALYDQIIDEGERLKTNLQGINAKTNVTTTSHDLQIFMWIRDGEEAMFSLHNYGPNTREDSFKTIDKRFITRLEAIADEEFNKAQKAPVQQASGPSQNATQMSGSPKLSPTRAESPTPGH